MQPLFIAAGTIAGVMFTVTFMIERWLRHVGHLPQHKTLLERVLSTLAFVAALVGMIGLICVACFTEIRNQAAHNTFLTLFMYVPTFLVKSL
jgi:hypothetical protein